MKAMILAAGFGTRLKPLTDTTPKPLIEVAGRPMISFALELLRAAGIRDVVINLHHLGDQIRRQLGDGSSMGLRIVYSPEDPILDTGGGISAARTHLEGSPFVILNSDTFIDLRLSEVLSFHQQTNALATMVVRPDPNALRRDDIAVDEAGRIHRILGHGEPMRPAWRRCMYPGVMVLGPRIFDYLGELATVSPVFSLTRDVYPRLLSAGERLFGFVHEGYWRVLDTPADLAAGRAEISRRQSVPTSY